jgi:hypothetical protein
MCRGEHLQVLMSGQMTVEAWLVNDGTNPRQ